MFIILLSYLRPLDEIDALLPAHREWLGTHYAEGRFVLSGPQEPRTGGVILADGPDRERIEEICASDPFALAGVATHTIVEILPTKGDVTRLTDAVAAALSGTAGGVPEGVRGPGAVGEDAGSHGR